MHEWQSAKVGVLSASARCKPPAFVRCRKRLSIRAYTCSTRSLDAPLIGLSIKYILRICYVVWTLDIRRKNTVNRKEKKNIRFFKINSIMTLFNKHKECETSIEFIPVSMYKIYVAYDY